MIVITIKKQKPKKVCHKKPLKVEDYKRCLEAAELENKISQLKDKIATDSLRGIYKEFIRNDRSILKSQQRLRSK